MSLLSPPPALEPSSPTSPSSSQGSSRHLPLIFSSSARSVPLASKGKDTFPAASRAHARALAASKGEDAFYCSPSSLGVADGVGGWVSLGVDAGLYSRELMSNAKAVVDSCGSSAIAHPQDILQRAYDAMPPAIVGTTTATIRTIDENLLKVSNLGDSGVLLLRFSPVSWSWTPIFRSAEQTHYFNCPLQLGTDATDFPRDANTYELALAEHDIVIVATDGVFDNLFDDDIAACITPHMDVVANKFNPTEAADAVVQAAIQASLNLTIQTPFSRGAREQGISHSGGKQDDVTCVVGHVIVASNDGDVSSIPPMKLVAHAEGGGIPTTPVPVAAPGKRTRGYA